MGIALLGLLTGWAGAAPACGDRATLLSEAREAVLSADLFRARTRLDALGEAWACGPPADPALLAESWLLEGALASFAGDEAGLRLSFQAARRLAPTLFVADLGPDLRRVWEAAAPGTETAGLTLLPPGLTWWVDGSPQIERPLAGLHLVQAGRGGAAEFATQVFLTAEQTATVDTGLPAPAAASSSEPPVEAGPRTERGGLTLTPLVAASVGPWFGSRRELPQGEVQRAFRGQGRLAAGLSLSGARWVVRLAGEASPALGSALADPGPPLTAVPAVLGATLDVGLRWTNGQSLALVGGAATSGRTPAGLAWGQAVADGPLALEARALSWWGQAPEVSLLAGLRLGR